MARPHLLRRRRDAWAASLAVLLLASALPTGPAQAFLLQLVTTEFAPGTFGEPAEDTDEVFVPTSADVTDNILASIGNFDVGYAASASAGVFGQVGLQARNTFAGFGSRVFSEVLVGSDEFVNVLSVPAQVQSSFVIDGGSIVDLASAGATVVFTLEVGAQNRGPVGPETDRSLMEIAAAIAAAFGGVFAPEFNGGRYVAFYTTDPSGAASFSDTVTGGLDLGATLDDDGFEIPFSLQTVDLGVVQPGDRLLLAYRARFDITLDFSTEGIFAGFSDPFNLSANSILTSLTFTPLAEPPAGAVPSPGTLPLLAAGLGLLPLGRRWR